MTASITVTASATNYTVLVSGGPGNPTDWVGVYVAGSDNHSELAWSYLNGLPTPPTTGMTSATLTFAVQPPGQSYDVRLFPSNSHSPVLASAAVPAVGTPPPAPAVVSDGMIHVDDPAFGATGNPNVDDTAALQAAAAAAKASASTWGSKGLYMPPGFICTASQPIDFRGIQHIDFRGWLVGAPVATQPFFKFGWGSKNQGARYFFTGFYAAVDFFNQARYPLVQFSGLRYAYVNIGGSNCFTEVYGDCDDPNYANTAWSEFHLGQTVRLEIRDNANNRNAWVNTNQFYGGALSQLRIAGPWIDVVSITGNVAQTAVPHGRSPGDVVEMYNGTASQMVQGLVTVVDATHFSLPNMPTSGTGWRCVSAPGYPHNDNHFHATDIEDQPAIVHIQGDSNRVSYCRGEATGQIFFGPGTGMNMVQLSNWTQHAAFPPTGNATGDFVVTDYSGGKNYVGWVRPPAPWS